MIELLVVIAVIAILVSILVPSLSRAKLLANVVACAVNMKSTGLALHTYASDANDFPPAFDVSEAAVSGFASTNIYHPTMLAYTNSAGQGHYWTGLLAAGKYSPSPQLQCTGLGVGRRGYSWENRHSGDDGTDGHYYYGGPLVEPDANWGAHPSPITKLDNPQTTWPARAGYSAENCLIRDQNVHLNSRGLRMLAVCPTVYAGMIPGGPPAPRAGDYKLEPHGNALRTEYVIGLRYITEAYYRNGLFSDGHVENRHRPAEKLAGPAGTDDRYRTNPWMPGNPNMFSNLPSPY